uniref:Uncharacterized protein n=1 Tax=viral metagenome TaxID=1070528 RepID=A0A6C0C688_9ZZZZ
MQHKRSYQNKVPLFLVDWSRLLDHLKLLFADEKKMQGFKSDFFKWCVDVVGCINAANINRNSVMGVWFETKRFIKDLKNQTPEQIEEFREISFLDMSWASPYQPQPHRNLYDATFKEVLDEICKRLSELIKNVQDLEMNDGECDCFEGFKNVHENFSEIFQKGTPLVRHNSQKSVNIQPQRCFKPTTSYAKMVANDMKREIEEAPKNVAKEVPQIFEEPVECKNVECRLVSMMHLKDEKVQLSPAICTDDISEYRFDYGEGNDDSVFAYTLTIDKNAIKVVKVVTSYGIIRLLRMFRFKVKNENLTVFVDTATANILKGNDELTYENERILVVQQVSKSFLDKTECIVGRSFLD